MAELIKVDTQATLVDSAGNDLEAERRLRILLMPRPYLHSGDEVPDEMRYIVVAEPPLGEKEAKDIVDEVTRHEELEHVLSVSPDDPLAGQHLAFTADHLGVQGKHLDRGAILAEIATKIVGVRIARIIFNKLVAADDLEFFRPEDFGVESGYYLEPLHFAYQREAE